MTIGSRVLSRTTLHRGRKFDYEQLVVAGAGGQTHTRELVRHPGAVVVVPILPDGRVVLIRVFRASIESMNLELCAGTLERGEDPAACAARELIEETGYRAGRIVPLGWFLTSPGLSDERMYAFAALDLEHVGQDLEEDEAIEVEIREADEVLGMICGGGFHDGKSMLALLLARRSGLMGEGGRGDA
ncbi:MAG: NUDIX hydrolase [Phycisphaerae bacterium]|nr:NUDIX hydrolase [Phycisphaerae bacterium]